MDEKPDVKDHTRFHYVGQSRLHSDGILKVTGKAEYTGDLKLPGMVYAKVFTPPLPPVQTSFGGLFGSEKMEGIQVVRDDELVAVLHELPDKAEEAWALSRPSIALMIWMLTIIPFFNTCLNAPSESREVRSSGNLSEGEARLWQMTLLKVNSTMGTWPIPPLKLIQHLLSGKVRR